MGTGRRAVAGPESDRDLQGDALGGEALPDDADDVLGVAAGLGVVGSDPSCVAGTPPEAVRLCIGGPLTRQQITHGLDVLAHALEGSPALASTCIRIRSVLRGGLARALSDEVDAGSSKESAAQQGLRDADPMQSGRIRL